MDATLGLPGTALVEYALASPSGKNGVDVKAPRANKRGWRTSGHIMTLSPTRAQNACSVAALP